MLFRSTPEDLDFDAADGIGTFRINKSMQLSLIHIYHMEMIVVDFTAYCFGHGTVDLIGVHDSREDILLTTHDLHSSFVGIRIELLGELIAAVIVKVGRVDIKDKFTVCLLYTSRCV